MKRYRCEILLTREEAFYVCADSEKKAKEKLEIIAIKKKKPGEKITSKYIHEVYNAPDTLICSSCGAKFSFNYKTSINAEKWHFCPSCGAKIKGNK